MPEDLKLDAGSIESDSISCYYLSLNDDEKYKLMKLLKSKENQFIEGEVTEQAEEIYLILRKKMGNE